MGYSRAQLACLCPSACSCSHASCNSISLPDCYAVVLDDNILHKHTCVAMCVCMHAYCFTYIASAVHPLHKTPVACACWLCQLPPSCHAYHTTHYFQSLH